MDKNNRKQVCAYVQMVVRTRASYGQKGSLPIDQTPAKDFNVNPDTGRPMSDIQKLVKMQDAVEMQAAFANLPELKAQFLPEGTTDEDAIRFTHPKLAQMPSEMAHWKQAIGKYQVQKAQLAQLRAERAAFDRELAEFRKSKVAE